MNKQVKKLIFIIIFFAVGFAAGFFGIKFFDQYTEKTATEINSFEQCAAAGNPVAESYPRQCRTADGKHFVEKIPEVVEPGEGLPEGEENIFCTTQYEPVCGEVQVQCIKAPCPPIKQTFSNRCFAERAKAFNIVAGECQ